MTGTSKAWLGQFGELGHPYTHPSTKQCDHNHDTLYSKLDHTHTEYASKEYCEQIISASTTGYTYNYTINWDRYNRSVIVPSGTITMDEILLHSLKYSDILEFDPTVAYISANIPCTLCVTNCTNPDSISTANPNTKTGTFSNSEIYANGAELSVSYSQIISWLTPTMTFKMVNDYLSLYFILPGAGMLGGVGTTFEYYIDTGSADITIKFMR